MSMPDKPSPLLAFYLGDLLTHSTEAASDLSSSEIRTKKNRKFHNTAGKLIDKVNNAKHTGTISELCRDIHGSKDARFVCLVA